MPKPSPTYPRPSRERLETFFEYYPETGQFYRIRSKRRAVRILWTSTDSAGYLRVFVDGYAYGVHIIIWVLMTGCWPTDEIDHKNGVILDNRWENLREASRKNNCVNTRVHRDCGSGFKGVRLREWGKYEARVSRSGKVYYLGFFESAELAHQAVLKKAKFLDGEFACVDLTRTSIVSDNPDFKKEGT